MLYDLRFIYQTTVVYETKILQHVRLLNICSKFRLHIFYFLHFFTKPTLYIRTVVPIKNKTIVMLGEWKVRGHPIWSVQYMEHFRLSVIILYYSPHVRTYANTRIKACCHAGQVH